MDEKIIVKGARTHNLKNITVEMPRNKMIVITGLSGSGKSSLAFDTIFAEGQRRYVESLSAYARQFLNQMQKPDVDEIQGLSPAISIDQKSRSNNPRSTVATITEIYDYLRILYARIGHIYCPKCGKEIKKLSREEMLDIVFTHTLENYSSKKEKNVLGISYDDRKVSLYAPLIMGRKGEYYQLLYDLLGKGYEKVRIDGKEYSLRERIDLPKNKKHSISVLVDEIYISLLTDQKKEAKERFLEAVENALNETDGLVEVVYPDEKSEILSSHYTCAEDGTSFPEVEPRLFSFNSPYGACSHCNGLGTIGPLHDEVCPLCHGARLRSEALHIYIGGSKKEGGKNVVDIVSLDVDEALLFFKNLSLSKKEKEIASIVLKEISARITFLHNVGLSYITLNRRAHTLSGGEAQRIRLASQLGSGLVGALYVLDEPTIGLHQKDNARLIQTLLALRDLGNTIIIVEHDEDTIFASDYIIDIGKGAGVHGGTVVASGWLDELLTADKNYSGSRTIAYLRGEAVIEVPKKRRTKDMGSLRIRGGNAFNIKNMSIDLPLGKMVCITGVSGSGKSTFMYEILFRNLRARLERNYRTNVLYNVGSFTGTEYISRVVLIDQSAIGRTSRSNPATYTGVWIFVRELFAQTTEARARGWKPSRFSFNVAQKKGGGRCEACQGNGTLAIEMHFLPTVYVSCDVCGGKRFTKDTLEVKFRKKNIYDILKMTIEEAYEFFNDIPQIAERLKTLLEVGLGYLEMGQSASTLSGGEAQRVKISSELYRSSTQKTIYLLDEPTVGLHYDDVAKLLDILERLVDKGHSVVLIEHTMDIVKRSDYLIDIGPDGGNGGGRIIAKGTPEEIAKTKGSYTGEYLKKVLK
jgi:excinuclease ABC subunit A